MKSEVLGLDFDVVLGVAVATPEAEADRNAGGEIGAAACTIGRCCLPLFDLAGELGGRPGSHCFRDTALLLWLVLGARS